MYSNQEMSAFENKILNMDCIDFLKQCPDKIFDLVLTDPPYFGIVRNDWDNQWKNIQEFQNWVETIGKELYRVLKDNGSFYWFGDDKTIAYCQIVLDKRLNLLNNIVWYKVGCRARKGARSVYKSYAPTTERILFYDKSNVFCEYLQNEFNKAGVSNKEIANLFPSKTGRLTGCVSNWLSGDNIITKEQYLKIREYLNNEYLKKDYEDLRRVWNNDPNAQDVLNFAFQSQNVIHPTQKPLDLISYLMQRSSNEDDLVLDCFSGSGTTAVACHKLKRRFICIERDREYFEASVKRLEEAKKQQMLF